jgi:leucyl-tRNA synthetase
VNGKVRDRLVVPTSAPQDEQERLARESEKVKAQLNGRQVVKAIVVPGKLVNLVVK